MTMLYVIGNPLNKLDYTVLRRGYWVISAHHILVLPLSATSRFTPDDKQRKVNHSRRDFDYLSGTSDSSVQLMRGRSRLRETNSALHVARGSKLGGVKE